jgi:S1-C subfamily serine protease
VLAGSVAESSGLRVNDVIIESAGLAAQGPEEVSGAVQRQAPGTWLPIKVRRGAETLEVVAKFPPRMP